MGQSRNVLETFKCHGVEFESFNSSQAVGECFLCQKKKHFYVNKKTGQWDCKSCLETGNVITFLTRYAEEVYEATSEEEFKRLSKLLRLPVSILKHWRLGFDGSMWLFPVMSDKGTVRDIRRWDPTTKIMKSTTGCKVQLYGGDRLAKVPTGGTIWGCEGESDCLAMSYVLRKAKLPNTRAVGVPGAGTFKDEWVPLFEGKHVVLAYDHDQPGRDGAKKAIAKLSSVALSIKVVDWPNSLPKSYDLRDFIINARRKGLLSRTILKKLKAMLKPADKVAGLVPPNLQQIEMLPPEQCPTFEETLTVYQRYLTMTAEVIDALKIILATVLSAILHGDPLWVFLISPPGGGKTVLLSSVSTAAIVVYQSSVTPRSLVSGCNIGGDPSLLPQLQDKCLVWKDFTEIMEMHPNSREEVYSVLRGAFDGSLRKTYGNGVIREYHNLYFSMLAGVTPAIHKDRQGALGERFLKYQMLTDPAYDPTDQIMSAITNIEKDQEVQDKLQEAARAFFSRKIDTNNLPKVPEWAVKRMTALAQIIGILRAQVDRDHYGLHWTHRPYPEQGTRLAKQLIKLGMFLAVVEHKDAVDSGIYALLERVGWDTAVGFNVEVIRAVVELQDRATVEHIQQKTGLPRTNVTRALDDLQAVRAIIKLKGQGPKTQKSRKPPDLYRLSDRVQKLWAQAGIGKKVAKTRKVRVKKR